MSSGVDTMNLVISKSKNSKSLYIKKSFRKNGKTTSKTVKKLGTMAELLPLHNNSEDEVIAWGKSGTFSWRSTKISYTDNGEVASEKEILLDEDRIIEEERYDGFYAVCTTLNDDIKDIVAINKRRWEIEESFRIMKSEFKARPVYLQKDNRIKAHFLKCFMALMFIRILESKTHNKLTVEELIDVLKNYNFQHFEGSGYIPAYTRNETTDLLHEVFDFRTDYQIVSEKNMKKILKKTKR